MSKQASSATLEFRFPEICSNAFNLQQNLTKSPTEFHRNVNKIKSLLSLSFYFTHCISSPSPAFFGIASPQSALSQVDDHDPRRKCNFPWENLWIYKISIVSRLSLFFTRSHFSSFRFVLSVSLYQNAFHTPFCPHCRFNLFRSWWCQHLQFSKLSDPLF